MPSNEPMRRFRQIRGTRRLARLPGVGVGVAAVLLICATGCANPVLYNQARDRQGEAAKAAVEEVDLVASVDAIDAKFKALAELEAATQKTRRTNSRDLIILELASRPSSLRPETTVGERYVQRWIDSRMNELGATAANRAETETLLRLAASKLRVLSMMTNVDIKDCATAATMKSSDSLLAGLPAAQRAGASLLLNDAVAACQKIPAGITASNDNGVIAKLQGELQKAQGRITDQQRRVKENKAELAAAVARAASEPSVGKTASEQLQDAAGKLEGALKTIKSVAGLADARAFNAAQAEMRFEALDKLLKALSSGDTNLDELTADQKQAVLIVRFIPSLTDEVRAWAQERERIRLAPLILAKENQRLVVAGYEAEQGVLQRRAKLVSRMLSAAEAEHLALVKARKVLVGDPDKPTSDAMATDLLQADFHQLLDSGPPAHRWRLYTSLTYFDEAVQHQLEGELLWLELDASSSDLAIVASRSAAAQWRSLAASIAAVLDDYHSAGIKPADLAAFLQAIGVVGIATQVGK